MGPFRAAQQQGCTCQPSSPSPRERPWRQMPSAAWPLTLLWPLPLAAPSGHRGSLWGWPRHRPCWAVRWLVLLEYLLCGHLEGLRRWGHTCQRERLDSTLGTQVAHGHGIQARAIIFQNLLCCPGPRDPACASGHGVGAWGRTALGVWVGEWCPEQCGSCESPWLIQSQD